MRAPLSFRSIAGFAPRPVAAAAAIAALAAVGAAPAQVQAQVQAPAPAASAAQAQDKTDADPKNPQIQKSEKSRDADQTLDRVEVSGTRASLQRSLNLKRSASGVQDSISATELGRFPDDNVADSLSHITGVSISRTAGGEGQKVSVRGLGPEYTLTTFNNRILATDGEGRDFAFDVLPSDIISGADVVKSAQASVMEGAIGGLVNLRSASPFDQPGQHGVLRVEGDRNLMSKLNGGKVSATYSNTFGKELGVLLGAVYADRKVRTDTAGNDGGWTRNPISDPAANWTGNAWGGNIDPNGNGVLDPDEEGLIGPGQFRVGTIQEQKKRTALSGKVEWRPSDAVKVTVDGIKTRLDSPQVGYQQSFYTLFAPGRWSNMQTKNGVVTGFTMDNTNPDLMPQSGAAQPDHAPRRRQRRVWRQRRVEGHRDAALQRRRLPVDLAAALGRAGHLHGAAHEPAQCDDGAADRLAGAQHHDDLRRRPRPGLRPGQRSRSAQATSTPTTWA